MPSRLDDLVVRNSHVQVSAREESKADTEEIEEVLNKEAIGWISSLQAGLDMHVPLATHPYARTSAPSSLACLRVLYPSAT